MMIANVWNTRVMFFVSSSVRSRLSASRAIARSMGTRAHMCTGVRAPSGPRTRDACGFGGDRGHYMLHEQRISDTFEHGLQNTPSSVMSSSAERGREEGERRDKAQKNMRGGRRHRSIVCATKGLFCTSAHTVAHVHTHKKTSTNYVHTKTTKGGCFLCKYRCTLDTYWRSSASAAAQRVVHFSRGRRWIQNGLDRDPVRHAC